MEVLAISPPVVPFKRVKHESPALSFAEIGERLGISEREARDACTRGMAKLRRNRQALAAFKKLVAALQVAREESRGR